VLDESQTFAGGHVYSEEETDPNKHGKHVNGIKNCVSKVLWE